MGRRMSNSTRIAGNIVGFAQAINSQGYNAAIKQFGLQSLVGKPIQEAAGILIDAFTGPGVTTDDNIARDAWCEAVKEIIGKGITDFATLTPAQWAEAVETFLCQAIELRILNEIGNEIVCIATDIARVDQIEEDIKIIIRDGFEGKLAPLIEDGQARSTSELQQCVNEIVGQAADYIEALGEDEKEEE